MKNSKRELDVDIIGGQKPLTKDEEKAISDFIKARKSVGKKRRTRIVRKKKVSP